VCDGAGRRAFAAALGEGPPVDLVLVCVGVADLRPLAETGEDGWTATLATNLVGVARLVEELLPALAPTGIVAVLSSEASRRPRWGLVPYAASKAALEVLVAGLRLERPGLRVSCAVVGATQPTEFGAGFTMDQLGPAMADWHRRGLFQEEMMATGDVAAVLLDLYGTALRHPGVGVEEVVLRSPSPLAGP
jgi:NAD(P)-dependent dehydrogenase (short-subunit alcohol dehydrogenase family)